MASTTFPETRNVTRNYLTSYDAIPLISAAVILVAYLVLPWVDYQGRLLGAIQLLSEPAIVGSSLMLLPIAAVLSIVTVFFFSANVNIKHFASLTGLFLGGLGLIGVVFFLLNNTAVEGGTVAWGFWIGLLGAVALAIQAYTFNIPDFVRLFASAAILIAYVFMPWQGSVTGYQSVMSDYSFYSFLRHVVMFLIALATAAGTIGYVFGYFSDEPLPSRKVIIALLAVIAISFAGFVFLTSGVTRYHLFVVFIVSALTGIAVIIYRRAETTPQLRYGLVLLLTVVPGLILAWSETKGTLRFLLPFSMILSIGAAFARSWAPATGPSIFNRRLIMTLLVGVAGILFSIDFGKGLNTLSGGFWLTLVGFVVLALQSVNVRPVELNEVELHITHQRQFLVGKASLTLGALVVVFIFVFPLFYWARLSITPYRYVFAVPPRVDFPQLSDVWWQVVAGGKSYQEAIKAETGGNTGVGGTGPGGYDIRPRIVNSVLLGLASTSIVILIATATAYALSRFNPRGKQNLVFFILSTRFMPPVAVVLPLYLIYKEVGLIDTYGGLILAHVVINLPLATLLLKSFFDDVPKDLDEAAMVDGCTRFGAFRRVVIRYVVPGIAAAGVLCFIFSWNEFIFALYLTRIPEMRTVPVTMMTYDASAGPTEWGMMASAGTAAMAPVFLFILFAQRYLIRGLTMGAVRG